MIQVAIRALAEGDGSTAAAIDRHIRSAYNDLPWGHRNLLPYYLRKLTASGEITSTHSGRYSLYDGPSRPDAAAPPPPPGTPPPPPPPPPKPSEGQNGNPSLSISPATQAHKLGGGDDGLANRAVVDDPTVEPPLAVLLLGHQKCATKSGLPHLSFRLLKRRLREGNSSPPQGLGGGGRRTHAAAAAASAIGDPVGSPVVRRRGRPPKPKAAIVPKDDQNEAPAGHEDQQSEAKLVCISSAGDPTGSRVPKRRGRPRKRQDAITLKDEQYETAGSTRQAPSASSNGDPASFPAIKRRGQPPRRRRAAMVLQGEQPEVAAGHEDRQSELVLVSSSTMEDLGSPVIERRGRRPKPSIVMLPDGQHEAAAGHEDPQRELRLMTSPAAGDPTCSSPVKRRVRPPRRKAAEACHEPEPKGELPEQNATARSSDGRRGDNEMDAECCKEGAECALPDHGGTMKVCTGIAGSAAVAAAGGEPPVSTRRGLVPGGGDERVGCEGVWHGRVTRGSVC